MKAINDPSKTYTVVDTAAITVTFMGTKSECFDVRNALGEKAYERYKVMNVKSVLGAGFLLGKGVAAPKGKK